MIENELETANKDGITTAETATPADILSGELLTVAEVANLFKISRKTVYAWGAQGKIQFLKVGGSLTRIRKDDLAALITEA